MCARRTLVLDTPEAVTPDAGVTYGWDGSKYHYNWKTKGLTAGEYRIYANLADGHASPTSTSA